MARLHLRDAVGGALAQHGVVGLLHAAREGRQRLGHVLGGRLAAELHGVVDQAHAHGLQRRGLPRRQERRERRHHLPTCACTRRQDGRRL